MLRLVLPRVRGLACLAVLLGCAATASAQQVRVSGRLVPAGWGSRSPLFTVEVIDHSEPGRLSFPTMTLVDTPDGPSVTSLSLALPSLGLAGASVAPRLGDQHLPGTFLYSPLSGASVHRPLRGITLSTGGRASWTLALGQLAPDPNTGLEDAGATPLAALALDIAPHRRVSVIPRLLVPLGSDRRLQASAGTVIRAQVSSRITLTTDLALAESAGRRWSPLASAGVLTRLPLTDIEALVVRGTASPDTWDLATAGSVDREQVTARVRALPGMTLGARGGRSRPAGRHALSGTIHGFDAAYQGDGWGRLTASAERTIHSGERLDTGRIEWQPSREDISVRYLERHATTPGDDAAVRRVEVELRSIAPEALAERVRLRAALAATAEDGAAPLTSVLGGRLRLTDGLTVTADTEIQVMPGDGSAVRRVKLGSDVGLVHGTSLHLGYSHRSGTAFSARRAFDVRLSKTIDLSLR